MKSSRKLVILNKNYETTNEISLQVDSEKLDSSIDSGYFIYCTKTTPKIKTLQQKCFSIGPDVNCLEPKRSYSVQNNNNGKMGSEVFPSRVFYKIRKMSKHRQKSMVVNKISIDSKAKKNGCNPKYQGIKISKVFSKSPSKVALVSQNLIDVFLKNNYKSPVVKLGRGCEYKRLYNTPFKQNYFKEHLNKMRFLYFNNPKY